MEQLSAPPLGAADRAPRAPAIHIGRLLREADVAFLQVFASRLASFGVSVAQYQHLRRLWERDGIVQNELSRSLRVKEASSSTVIAGLVAKGFVARRRSRSDRRKLRLHVTPKGAALEPELIACAQECSRTAFTGFSDEEVAALLAMLRRVAENMRAATPGGA